MKGNIWEQYYESAENESAEDYFVFAVEICSRFMTIVKTGQTWNKDGINIALFCSMSVPSLFSFNVGG